jgi:hypothetical protein
MGCATFRDRCDGTFSRWRERFRSEFAEDSAEARLRDAQCLLCEVVETPTRAEFATRAPQPRVLAGHVEACRERGIVGELVRRGVRQVAVHLRQVAGRARRWRIAAWSACTARIPSVASVSANRGAITATSLPASKST